MLTVASLLAAMTIAGAFWVGVLAARRLRDWGEGRRAIDEGGPAPLALAAASGAPPDDARTRRVRELVAQRLRQHRTRELASNAWSEASPPRSGTDELEIGSLRAGDVVVVETTESIIDGDFIVEGLVHLREGGSTSVIATLTDAGRQCWLVGSPGGDQWMIVEPIVGHGLAGEPPRHIHREGRDYALQRRGQASAAGIGRHGRPELPRVATYLYTASARDVLWLERWGHEVLMGQGRVVEPHEVSFLPGS
jgi:hypothetical protein